MRKATLLILALSLCSSVSARTMPVNGPAGGNSPESGIAAETAASVHIGRDSCDNTPYMAAGHVIISGSVVTDGHERVALGQTGIVREQPSDGDVLSAFKAFLMRIPIEIVFAASQLLGITLLTCGIKRNERLRRRSFGQTPGGGAILSALVVFIVIFTIIFTIIMIRFLGN